MSCSFRRTGIVVDGVFDIEAVRRMMIYHVFGDPVWFEIINESVDFCYARAESENLFANTSMTCDGLVPFYTFRIIDCVYARNYQFCPDAYWNPVALDFCDGTEDYIAQCLEWP